MGVNPIYRHEEKFLIGIPQYQMLKSMLSTVMHRDAYASLDGRYSIRSLYFDTMNNKDFFEKESGIEIRRKIRLRTYMPEARDFKLEIKNRKKNGIYKESVFLTREEAERFLINPRDYNFFLNYNTDAARHLVEYFATESYHPVIIIDYEREAFTLPFYHIRITFDTALRASRNVKDFFNVDSMFCPVLPWNEIILEIKYDFMIPDFLRRMLGTVPSQEMSISKYCISRSVLEGM